MKKQLKLKNKQHKKKNQSQHRNTEIFKAFQVAGAYPGYKPMKQKVYSFTQSFEQAFLTTSVAVTTYNAISFTAASNIDQYASLANIFDQYRIVRIEVWIVPRSNVSISSNLGQLASVTDYDDSNMLTTYPQALDYSNCLQTAGLSAHYRSFTPRCAIAAYAGAFTSFANVASPWIDWASTGVQHYGVKVAHTLTDAAYIYDLQARLHVECRNVR